MIDERIDRIRALLSTDAAGTEQIVSATTQWESLVFCAERLEVIQPDGSAGIRDVVWHRGGAGVLALDEHGRMCVVRQWRVTLGRTTLEIPAGKIDGNEDGANAAARELAEETGLVAHRLTLIAKAVGSPGFTNETTSIYRASELEVRTACPDPNEFVDVVWVDPQDVIVAASAGLIQDAKTIIAAYAALADPQQSQTDMVECRSCARSSAG